jgi:hypothetical protein
MFNTCIAENPRFAKFFRNQRTKVSNRWAEHPFWQVDENWQKTGVLQPVAW